MPMDPEHLEQIKEAIKEKLKTNPEHALTLGALYFQLEKSIKAEDILNTENQKNSFSHYQKERQYTKEAEELISSGAVLGGAEIEKIEQELGWNVFTPEERLKTEFINENTIETPTESIWANMLFKCEEIGSFINEDDRLALKNLTKIELKRESPEDTHFTVYFWFSENEYFSNEQLWIKAERDVEEIDDEIEQGFEDSDIIVIDSSPIHWRNKKNLTSDTIIKKQRNRRTGQTRTVKRTVKKESFFNIFTNLVLDDILDDVEDQTQPLGETDPTADKEIFYMAIDVLEMIHNSFFQYLTPVHMGVLPQCFKMPEIKGVTDIAQSMSGANAPECKQQ